MLLAADDVIYFIINTKVYHLCSHHALSLIFCFVLYATYAWDQATGYGKLQLSVNSISHSCVLAFGTNAHAYIRMYIVLRVFTNNQ